MYALARLSSLAVCLLVFVVGCQVYDPDLVVDGGSAACDLRHPPARPSIEDDGADVGEVGFALKDVQFEQDGARWRTIGYDLDGLCTTPPDYLVECVPPASGVRPEVDGEGGTDNAFGHVFYPFVAITVPGLQQVSRNAQTKGEGAIILRINGWNGLNDDPRVELSLAITVFGSPATTEGSRPDITVDSDGVPRLPDGGSPPPPAWEGSDYFWARDDNFIGGDETRPRVRDDNAYVSDGVLVARLPARTDFVFPGTDVGLLARLTGAIVTARMSDDRQRLTEVNVAGRWSINDMLDTAQSVGVCEGEDLYDNFEALIDRIADVRSTPGSGGAGIECDAMSVGIALKGLPGNFGGVAPGPELANACKVPLDAGVADAGVADAGVADGG